MTPPRKPQIRLRYAKLGKVRFTSHRDMARIWERAVRRVQLPIAYSEGYSPRARLSFGLALPTVFESMGEYVDLTLDEPVELDGLAERLSAVLPDGVDVTGVVELHGKVDSLQECVVATSWSLFVAGDPVAAQAWRDDVLGADELLVTRERKGKQRTDDVRPAILDVTVRPSTTHDHADVEIHAELAAKPRALRPLELLDVNTPPFRFVLGRRQEQFIAPLGARRDPLDGSVAGAAEVPHSVSRAS